VGAVLLYAGYGSATVPFVKQNLTWVILGIIALSLLPLAFEYYGIAEQGKSLNAAPPGISGIDARVARDRGGFFAM